MTKEIVDNPTDYPFDKTLYSDYGFEVIWNASRGRKELLHIEYMNRMNAGISSHRSKRIADLPVRMLSIVPFLDTPFVIKWVWNSQFYCLVYDIKSFTIRTNDIGEFL